MTREEYNKAIKQLNAKRDNRLKAALNIYNASRLSIYDQHAREHQRLYFEYMNPIITE